jgi:lipid II:glycine glycyltransferase (peptidoglycan interpeptide bridge formation enzyme)
MEVKKLEKKYYKRYEAFLLKSNKALFYYSIKYKLFLEELLDVESNYLLVVDKEDTIEAVLPLMKKEGKFGTVINSLPYYGSNGGIVSSNKEAYQLLLNYYYQFSQEVAGSTYILNPLEEDVEPIEYDILDKRIGQWTTLDYSEKIEENIMKSFNSSARRNVRKAIKSNVKVEIDNNQIEFLYETHYENITAIGGKAKDKRFFELIEKHFEKGVDYNIYVATVDECKVGALLLFYYNKTVEYFTPSAVSEYRNIQALPLIIYRAMSKASSANYRWWNWGGTWLTQDGVYRFKSKFGAVDKEYYYFIGIRNQEIYNASKEELLDEYDNFYVIPFDRLKEVK